MSIQTLFIESLAFGGEGIGRIGGKAVFVSGTAPGDRVEVEIFEEHERSSRGRLVRIISPSSARITPACPHYDLCGGCSWGHIAIEAQREAKEKFFWDSFERIGGIGSHSGQVFKKNRFINSPKDFHYRRRATFHLIKNQLGYKNRASHDNTPISSCLLLDERINQALQELQKNLLKYGSPSRVTQVAIACDDSKAAAAFFFEMAAKIGAEIIQRIEKLIRLSGLAGAVLVPQSGPARIIGNPNLSWNAQIHSASVVLHGRPDLFSQANRYANELLVEEAIRMAEIDELAKNSESGPAFLELFAGAGNFTFALAQAGARLTAIEACGQSLELARTTAREARLGTIRFIQGDALKTAASLAKEGYRADLLFLDPPRAGARGVGNLAKKIEAKQVVYVSCDPATLSRDLRELIEVGFVVEEATPIDMFPQTFHVEGVVILRRRDR